MQKLSKKEVVVVGLMLFSLFFGAGNLIFPPFLGESAGTTVWLSTAGFLVTAVGFPILGTIVVARTKGLQNLAGKVNKRFAFVYTILIYLSIGPFLGIPRAGSLPFEMAVAPFVSEEWISHKLALFLFTAVFFSIAYWLSLNPSKLVDRMGKGLTPLLLCLLVIIFAGSFFQPFGSYGKPIGNFNENPIIEGFLGGYLTMDTIAALNFGIVISMVIKEMGVKKEEDIVHYTAKAGGIAGLLLVLIYSALAYLGALSGNLYGNTENGAQTLANIMTHIFGQNGLVLLAVVFSLACLTTAVGLITSCSQYFETITPLRSKTWVKVFVIWSFVTANMGLTSILAISVPVLDAIYPIALVLIVLSLFDRYLSEQTRVYPFVVWITALFSILKVMEGTRLGHLSFFKFLGSVPFFEEGLGWVLPAVFGICLGVILDKARSYSRMKKES